MTGNSWVTLATNDSYSLGALVLGHSLKRTGTVHSLSVMVTPGVSSSMREQLSTVFNVVQEVNILDSKDEENLSLLTRPELGVTFTKLHCWKLTQFTKCVFLDADVLVLRNCDELFEREELSAAPDVGWPDCFNSGVFVYRPSIETYNAIINLALSQGSFDGGDQGLLNQFFSDWATKDISRHLPFIYNMCSSATYSYLPAFKQFGKDVKIIHFIGSSKPWLQYLDSETRQVRPTLGSEHLQGLLQLWWDIFCNDVHSKLSSEMVGLAGALSQLTLGVARSSEQIALEEHLRKQAWEHGSIDYMGRDSFDNIWRKICQTLAEPLPDPLPEKCEPPSQVSGVIINTVSQEVTTDDISPTSLPQSQSDLSACKEITDSISSGITSSMPFNNDEMIIATAVSSDRNSESDNIILALKEINLPKSSAENKPNEHFVSSGSLLHDSAGNIPTLSHCSELRVSPEHGDSSLLMSSEIIPDSHRESQQLQQTPTILKETQISEAENICQTKTLSDISRSDLPYTTSTIQKQTCAADNLSDLSDTSLIQKAVNTLSQKDLPLESDSLRNDGNGNCRIMSHTVSDKLERQLDGTSEKILPFEKELIDDNKSLSCVSLGSPERISDFTSSSEPTSTVKTKSIVESDNLCETSSNFTEKPTDSNITGGLTVMDSSKSNVIDEISSAISSEVVKQSDDENDTAKSEYLDSSKTNVPPVPLTAKSNQTEAESTSVVSRTVPQDVKVIGPTPPTSPSEIFVPGTGAFDDANILTIDSSIPETPPLDSLCDISSTTSNISNIASTSEIGERPVQTALSQAVDPQPPVPPKRRHRPSHKAQRGKK